MYLWSFGSNPRWLIYEPICFQITLKMNPCLWGLENSRFSMQVPWSNIALIRVPSDLICGKVVKEGEVEPWIARFGHRRLSLRHPRNSRWPRRCCRSREFRGLLHSWLYVRLLQKDGQKHIRASICAFALEVTWIAWAESQSYGTGRD